MINDNRHSQLIALTKLGRLATVAGRYKRSFVLARQTRQSTRERIFHLTGVSASTREPTQRHYNNPPPWPTNQHHLFVLELEVPVTKVIQNGLPGVMVAGIIRLACEDEHCRQFDRRGRSFDTKRPRYEPSSDWHDKLGRLHYMPQPNSALARALVGQFVPDSPLDG